MLKSKLNDNTNSYLVKGERQSLANKNKVPTRKNNALQPNIGSNTFIPNINKTTTKHLGTS